VHQHAVPVRIENHIDCPSPVKHRPHNSTNLPTIAAISPLCGLPLSAAESLALQTHPNISSDYSGPTTPNPRTAPGNADWTVTPFTPRTYPKFKP
jgi:hypothetical protein